MFKNLDPVPAVGADALASGKRALVWDSAWASLAGGWSGGVVLVAFALSLGAQPMVIGLLAAIPFAAQAVQLPTIFIVEKFRQRKKIGVISLNLARLIILLLGLLPFFVPGPWQLPLLLAAQLAIAVLGSIAACAINSWFHQLLPPSGLGEFFSKRLLIASMMACGGTLVAGLLVDHPPLGEANYAFALAFVAAGLAGFASSACLARAPEPEMHTPAAPMPMRDMLREPMFNPNFRRLALMLGSWNLASNLVAPFLTVYLIQQLGFSLSVITLLWVTSQLANAAALNLWGQLSDRLSNKAVLRVAFPAYFLSILGIVIAAGMTDAIKLPLLYALHVLMGIASGGASLATGNLNLKLAPKGKATSYLAMLGLVSAVAGGVAPIAGGVIAQWFSVHELAIIVRWIAPRGGGDMAVLEFAHWEFLFALSAAMGLYVLHALSRVQEGVEISERKVIQELGLEALRAVNHLSSAGGLLVSLFTFERVAERRKTPRHGTQAPPMRHEPREQQRAGL